MDISQLLTNKSIPTVVAEKADPQTEYLFALVSDLSRDARYTEDKKLHPGKKQKKKQDIKMFAADSILFTKDALTVISPTEDSVRRIAFSDIQSVAVKRMYGNAYLKIEKKNGETEVILRFTYQITVSAEAAARYIKNVIAGEDYTEEVKTVQESYERLQCVCPNCGRTLLRPGATCIHCRSKRQIVSRLSKYVKPELKVLILCIINCVITTTIALIPPYTNQMIVDDFVPNKNYKAMLWMVVFMFVAYVVHYGLMAHRSYLLRAAGNRIVMNLRSDVYERAQYLPMRFYDKTPTGSVINRISSDSLVIQSFILNISQNIIVQSMLLVGIIVIMLSMNWWLTLISLLPVPLVVVGSRIFRKKIAPYYRKIWRRWSAVTSLLTDTIPCVRVVKTFAAEKRAVNKFKEYNEDWRIMDTNASKITSIYPQAVNFLITIGTLAIWAFGGRMAMEEGSGLTLGTLVAFISYTSIFYNPINYLANLSDTYQNTLASVERVLDILDADLEVDDEDEGIKPKSVKGKIEFKNINFSFDRSKKVLSDVNFVIEPGDVVGIVGTTGSGKSTLINLLLRFYDNYEGTIYVDDVDLKEYNPGAFREVIGYVQQEPMMFRDTIFNNIAYGRPDAQVEEVFNAAEIANAHSFIVKQPDGYDSMLGERGIGLSGGEKQRVSIARAVLKNPSILIFDEATAAVDSETESLIQEAIDRMISGRTTLMIAHRLSTLRKANKIIVMENGKIIEMGSQEELLAKKGKYYTLVQIQNMGSKQQAKEEV